MKKEKCELEVKFNEDGKFKITGLSGPCLKTWKQKLGGFRRKFWEKRLSKNLKEELEKNGKRFNRKES